MDVSINVGPTVSINEDVELRDKERTRESIEDWLLEQLTDREPEVLRQLGNEIRSTGYTEEYGTPNVTILFNLESEDELVVSDCKLDSSLYEETWMTNERVERLESQLKDLCEQAASEYN